MTDPVETDALRARSADDDALGYPEAAALQRAAADEVDRLRASALQATLAHNAQISRGNALAREVGELRAVIENAPHQLDCNTEPGGIGDPNICTCWKADVL